VERFNLRKLKELEVKKKYQIEITFRKWEGIVGTGWSGLRIGTGGGYL
jgi:hypothetical protein